MFSASSMPVRERAKSASAERSPKGCRGDLFLPVLANSLSESYNDNAPRISPRGVVWAGNPRDGGSGTRRFRESTAARRLNQIRLATSLHRQAPERFSGSVSLMAEKARTDGMRSTRIQTQALSRPDNLAHDSRKASLGIAEYPAARLLLDRSWGKGRGYVLRGENDNRTG